MSRLRASLLTLLLATCGCTTTYRWTPGHVGPPGTRARSMQTSEQTRWAHLFVFGLVGTSSVDLRDVCPGPVGAGLRTGMTFKTTLVSILTLGIYTPLEHRFSCVIPPPGPLTIPKVVLEETPSLQPELDDSIVPRDAERSPSKPDGAPELDDAGLDDAGLDDAGLDAPAGDGSSALADDEGSPDAVAHEPSGEPQDTDPVAPQGDRPDLDADAPGSAPRSAPDTGSAPLRGEEAP
ncbi:MAG: hypothetical protein GX607_11805 [Myxococcales bacterium]|nr:hypothetical protein [Myxococcales bacterium]